MNETLEKIRAYADAAHGEQLRKYTPERYIVHPVRVMETCARYSSDQPSLAAALLHDVLEDTPVKADEMLQFLQTVMSAVAAERTLQLVVELTDVYTKEAYPQWNRRMRKELERERMARISADAQTIKYADIIDNAQEITVQDPQFAPRFLKECKMMLQVMRQGHAGLYHQAKELVINSLNSLPRKG